MKSCTWTAGLVTPTILFVLPQSYSLLTKSVITDVIRYRSFKNSVHDYSVYDLYHLLESLNFDNSEAITTCFHKFEVCLGDIVNFHAPLKSKIIRKINVRYMNIERRKRKGIWCIKAKINILVLKVMNGTQFLEKCCKSERGTEKAVLHWAMWRCSKKHFWPTFKPFISSRHNANIDSMLIEHDSMIRESKSVAKILNKYWNEIAKDI